jgi:hypothetical protein
MKSVETTDTLWRPAEHASHTLRQESLFDQTGRFIPLPLSRVYSHVSRRYFILKQPSVNLSAIHGRISRYLKATDLISPEEFERRALQILERMAASPVTRNLMNAVRIPFFCTPQQPDFDLGLELDRTYLPALKNSYEEQ